MRLFNSLRNRTTSLTGGLFRTSREAAGIDVGSCLTKFVSLQQGPSGLTLQNFAIDATAKNEAPGLTPYEHVVRHLPTKSFFSSVGMSVSGPQTLVKTISLPVMAEKDIREHLSLELDRYLFLDNQEVVWDVYCPGLFVPLKDHKRDYYVVVSKKKFIEDRMQQFRIKGIHIQFVEVEIFSLINLVAFNYDQDSTVLIVHLGPAGISLILMETGQPVHIRQASYEGEWYGDLVHHVICEQTPSPETMPVGTESILLDQLFNETTHHIMESLKISGENSGKVMTPPILLSGGYSLVEGLASHIEEGLSSPVSLIDPFRKILLPQALQQDPTFRRSAPLLSVAVGVALRGIRPYD